MKIIHFCLSNFYIDGMNYQENALIREHVKAGHDVLVVASTENLDKDKKLYYVSPSEYVGQEGARVIRLPYRGWPHTLAKKLRIHPNVYKIIEDFSPDAMMFHSMCGWEFQTVAHYKRKNPHVIFYADSHEDHYNSARSFISRELLHRCYYAPIARRAAKEVQKVLCVNVASMEFMRDFYGIPEDKLEFFPLAGEPLLLSVIQETRAQFREAISLDEKHIIFVQSGKQTVRKKLIESLEAFIATPDPRFRLLIVGMLFEDIKDVAERLINSDSRIMFLGWKDPEELKQILCAADVYLQPGTQSATMQEALCAGTAVIVDDVPSHKPYIDGNGWKINNESSLKDIFTEIAMDGADLKLMGERSNVFAHKVLDYKEQAKRILQ
jgi:glycosyltransferase involved in cell wall biosynthesis